MPGLGEAAVRSRNSSVVSIDSLLLKWPRSTVSSFLVQELPVLQALWGWGEHPAGDEAKAQAMPCLRTDPNPPELL